MLCSDEQEEEKKRKKEERDELKAVDDDPFYTFSVLIISPFLSLVASFPPRPLSQSGPWFIPSLPAAAVSLPALPILVARRASQASQRGREGSKRVYSSAAGYGYPAREPDGLSIMSESSGRSSKSRDRTTMIRLLCNYTCRIVRRGTVRLTRRRAGGQTTGKGPTGPLPRLTSSRTTITVLT